MGDLTIKSVAVAIASTSMITNNVNVLQIQAGLLWPLLYDEADKV